MKIEFLAPWPQGKPPAPDMCGEETRAGVLAAYGLDALQDDAELAEISQFAAKLCDAPIALVTLVEKERQRFLTRVGLEDRETPRPTSFCAHAMLHAEPMVVPDAQEDPRFSGNPLVLGHPHIRFYAGAPLISHEGAPLGSLCIIDTVPRPDGLTDIQIQGLKVMASSVMRRLRHRREHLEAVQAQLDAAKGIEQLIDSLPQIAFSMNSEGKFDYVNGKLSEVTGLSGRDLSDGWRDIVHEDDRDELSENWQSALAQREPFEAEFRLKLESGDWHWMLTRIVPTEAADEETRWFGLVIDIEEQHRETEVRDLLTRELSHRIKNIFAVVSGLISLKQRNHAGAAEFAAELIASIHALGKANDFVRPTGEVQCKPLEELLEILMAPYRKDGDDRIAIDVEPTEVGEKAVTPLALVFHELATNAAKYGALSNEMGQIRITGRISENGERMQLDWIESGCERPEEGGAEGFGSRLVKLAVEGQLDGSLTREICDDGIELRLDLSREAIGR
ncbi:sensor histidine kinase [Altererythrobacter sp. CAU 1778]